MNQFILEQLKKCKIANIQPYLESDQVIKINGAKKPPELLYNRYYHIILENYIVNPPPNFDLAINWNNGTKPSSTEMNIHIVQATCANLTDAKMIKISGVCLPDKIFWEGWVPKKSIISFEEI